MDWVQARKRDESHSLHMVPKELVPRKWSKPEVDTVKINVDASFFPGAASFSVGMVMRDHSGLFLAGRTLCLSAVDTVVEAETIGIREILSWCRDTGSEWRAMVESDSLLFVNAITCDKNNLLELGEVIEDCRQILRDSPHISIHFIRRMANKVAHEIARITCLVNSEIIFTIPPTCLLETLAFDL